jgi:hypothetical protein
MTASDVHDPLSAASLREPVGANADLGALNGLMGGRNPGSGMVDGRKFDAHKMYKDTKLCNIMFMHELQRRLKAVGVKPSDVAVNAFSPGLITESSFFRHKDVMGTNELGVSFFNFLGENVIGISDTVKNGGALLAKMAANPKYYKGSDNYWSNELVGDGPIYPSHEFVDITTSTESQIQEEAARLYDVSGRLVGVNPTVQAKAAALRLQGGDEQNVDRGLSSRKFRAF